MAASLLVMPDLRSQAGTISFSINRLWVSELNPNIVHLVDLSLDFDGLTSADQSHASLVFRTGDYPVYELAVDYIGPTEGRHVYLSDVSFINDVWLPSGNGVSEVAWLDSDFIHFSSSWTDGFLVGTLDPFNDLDGRVLFFDPISVQAPWGSLEMNVNSTNSPAYHVWTDYGWAFIDRQSVPEPWTTAAGLTAISVTVACLEIQRRRCQRSRSVSD